MFHLSDGADLRRVQQQMGHATIGQTADTYGHVQPDRHETAAAGLARYPEFTQGSGTVTTGREEERARG